MKIVQINATCGLGSTGKICVAVSELLTEKGIENYIFYTLGNSSFPSGVKYSSLFYTKSQALKSRVLGNYGFNSRRSTKKLLSSLEKISPDVIHLHNLHAHNVHLGMLFDFIKEKKIKVYWTFHDCWPFTSYCPYFESAKCDRWQSECHTCPQKRRFSWFFDRSREMYRNKKEILNGVDLTVITPSEWLANHVKRSFFKDHPIKVIHNGINLKLFRPTESRFRERYGFQDKYILLGVANGWDERKGLATFDRLAKTLDPRFQIVLVGEDGDKTKDISEKILVLPKTKTQEELAEIYSAADLFVNPTVEDNYPTVNMEALACGTPVLTYDTGGCGEIVDESCGRCVSKGNEEALREAIVSIANDAPFTKEACLARACSFDEKLRFDGILSLYGVTSAKIAMEEGSR